MFLSRDPADMFRSMPKLTDPSAPPPNSAAGAAARNALHPMLLDSGDELPLVEVTGDLSFLEYDGLLTAREFAALLTNTRPRADVVPQQGSSVASVATLMPSDRPEAADPAAVNELSSLLIDPLTTPPPAAAAPAASEPPGGDSDEP